MVKKISIFNWRRCRMCGVVVHLSKRRTPGSYQNSVCLSVRLSVHVFSVLCYDNLRKSYPLATKRWRKLIQCTAHILLELEFPVEMSSLWITLVYCFTKWQRRLTGFNKISGTFTISRSIKTVFANSKSHGYGSVDLRLTLFCVLLGLQGDTGRKCTCTRNFRQ